MKPKRPQTFREDCVLGIGSDFGDNIHIIGSADWCGSLIGDQQTGRATADEDNLGQERTEPLRCDLQ